MSTVKKLVAGWGINDADYPVVKFETLLEARNSGRKSRLVLWKCPYYRMWASILNRVVRGKRYKGASVDPRWRRFSAFRSWAVSQPYSVGNVLDKDIKMGVTTKIYSPDTCMFVSPRLNAACMRAKGYIKKGNIFLPNHVSVSYQPSFKTEPQALEWYSTQRANYILALAEFEHIENRDHIIAYAYSIKP
tara:strand:- start:87 stop:656 length:570 start_codon:yes stop_codon:yes gene_type:complete